MLATCGIVKRNTWDLVDAELEKETKGQVLLLAWVT